MNSLRPLKSSLYRINGTEWLYEEKASTYFVAWYLGYLWPIVAHFFVLCHLLSQVSQGFCNVPWRLVGAAAPLNPFIPRSCTSPAEHFIWYYGKVKIQTWKVMFYV